MAVHAAATLPEVDRVDATARRRDQRLGLTGCRQPVNAELAAHGSHATRTMWGMALLTEHGRARFEHGRDGAAMRTVAYGTILRHRVMLANKGTALFRVAGVACVIHAIALGQLGAGGTMHVVTIGTCHFALGHGVMRWAIDLVALLLMAGEAKLGLLGLAHNFILVTVHLVASVARYIGRVVLTASPQGSFEILAVARLTDLATLAGGRGGEFADDLTEANIGFWLFISIRWFVRVGLTRAMTTNAIRRPFIGNESVRRPTHVGQILAVVTGDTKRRFLCVGGAPSRTN